MHLHVDCPNERHSDPSCAPRKRHDSFVSQGVDRVEKCGFSSRVEAKKGSARESDEVPNWRGFQDFGFLTEIGSLVDCHNVAAANHVGGIEAEGSLGWSRPSPGMDGTGSNRKSFIL